VCDKGAVLPAALLAFWLDPLLPSVVERWVSWAHFLAVLATVPFILLARKSPQAKLGWLLAIVALPWVGLLFYWAVGRDWLNRRVLRLRHARVTSFQPTDRMLQATIDQLRSAPRGSVAQELVLAAEMEGVSAPYPCNEVLPLAEGPAAFKAAREAVDAAVDHIHVLTYIFRDDRTGRGVLEALVNAARRGVAVRVLFDALGSYWTKRRFFKPLVDAGGHVASFLPLGAGLRGLRVNLRNHRKILVVDGHTGFTGGMNVADEYATADGWRDVHARIRGPAVLGLQRVFVEDWHFATGELLDAERWFPEVGPRGEASVQVLSSGPDQGVPVIENTFFAAIAGARRRIDILTPYFVPNEALEAALADAARRGRQVRVILPARPDHRLVALAADGIVPRLMAEGVEFWAYPRMLHGKVMAVDDAWATLGSANMDSRSFRLNFEVNVAFPHAATARRVRDVIDVQLAECRRLAPEDYHFSLPGRLLRGVAGLFAPVL
jgi:cardiolipin synthase